MPQTDWLTRPAAVKPRNLYWTRRTGWGAAYADTGPIAGPTLSGNASVSAFSQPRIPTINPVMSGNGAWARTMFGFSASTTRPTLTAKAWDLSELTVQSVPLPDDLYTPPKPAGVPESAWLELDYGTPGAGFAEASQLTVVWGIHAVVSGGVGTAQAHLCTLGDAATLDPSDPRRVDQSAWLPIDVISDGAPHQATDADTYIQDGYPIFGTASGLIDAYNTEPWTLKTTLIDLADRLHGPVLGLTTPETLTAPSPVGYPLHGVADGYAVAAAVFQITATGLYTYPAYRWVWDAVTTGLWRTRQRQSPAGADGWPPRQRQNRGATGTWPTRQRQLGS